eukprot:gene19462-25344_t
MSWFGLGGSSNKNTTESKTPTSDKIEYTVSSPDIEFSQPSSLSQNDSLPSLSTRNFEKECAKEDEKLQVNYLVIAVVYVMENQLDSINQDDHEVNQVDSHNEVNKIDNLDEVYKIDNHNGVNKVDNHKKHKSKKHKEKKQKKDKDKSKKDKDKKKHKRKRSKDSDDDDSDNTNSDSSSDNSQTIRSSITGKKIKLHRKETLEDKLMEIERAAKRHFMNNGEY